MKIILQILLITITFVNTAFAKCGDFEKDLTKSVYFKNNTLFIENTFLAFEIADKIENELINRNITKVKFKCIIGGLTKDTDRLLPYFKKIDVEIFGACNSACAILASYSKNIIFIKNFDTKYPTSMMIHATHDLNSSKNTNDGLRHLALYVNRFPSISEEIFNKILTDKRVGNYGLIITESSTNDMQSKSSSAFICEPFPDKCNGIAGATLNSLNIKRK